MSKDLLERLEVLAKRLDAHEARIVHIEAEARWTHKALEAQRELLERQSSLMMLMQAEQHAEQAERHAWQIEASGKMDEMLVRLQRAAGAP